MCTVSASRTSAGTSSRSGSLRSGTKTSVRPARCAASTCCCASATVFGASLLGLVGTPHRYGQNWAQVLDLGFGGVTSQFGALAPIYGTLVTSAIALVIGVPVSFGIALFLTELSPGWLRRPLGESQLRYAEGATVSRPISIRLPAPASATASR